MTKDDFWTWFDANKLLLENLISEKTKSYEIYETLSEKLSQYSEYLIPELTINEKRQFVLVISCDGIIQGIPFVEALTENLRRFDNWVVVKYRQPDPMGFIPVNGLNLKRKDILLQWRKSMTQRYFLTFYVKGFSANNKNYEIGTILHLDHTIGEYDAMTRIEGFEIKRLGLFQSRKSLRTLDELKIELDSKLS